MAEIEHVKLYHYPVSRSARVRWALHETFGDDYEIERVDLYGGDQFNEEYLQRNPNHCVPTLEITFAGGRVQRMIESAAMVAFLADAFPEKQLSPPANTPSPERADYLSMLHFAGTWMDMILWQIRIHEHILPEGERDPRTVTRYRKKFASEVEPQLRQRLSRTPYICGDAFTAADILAGYNVMWARGYEMCGEEVFASYLGRLVDRPAYKKAFSDAGVFRREPPADSPIRAGCTG